MTPRATGVSNHGRPAAILGGVSATPPSAQRPAEARALEVAREFPGERLLGVTLGGPGALGALAGERPEAGAVCWMRDQFRARRLSDAALPVNLRVECAADLPEGPYDLAVLPFSMRGDAELTRETLQAALDRLDLGGLVVTSTDNPRDAWLRQQADALETGVRMWRFDDAVVYAFTKKRLLKKRRDFACEFPFRDRGRLLTAVTRPGVFSHRHVDPGARRLLDAAEVAPGDRVVDIGCGAGTVAMGLAARESSAWVLAVDSDTRAIQCTMRGAELNGLDNVVALLDASGEYPDPGTFDLAVTNPPYYADHQIAAKMVAAAGRSLRPGGRLVAVTKTPNWYRERLPDSGWGDVQLESAKGYWVVSAVAPCSTGG